MLKNRHPSLTEGTVRDLKHICMREEKLYPQDCYSVESALFKGYTSQGHSHEFILRINKYAKFKEHEQAFKQFCCKTSYVMAFKSAGIWNHLYELIFSTRPFICGQYFLGKSRLTKTGINCTFYYPLCTLCKAMVAQKHSFNSFKVEFFFLKTSYNTLLA